MKLYVKECEMPSCCAKCKYFKSGQSIESMWCELGINYLHLSVNSSRDERCPLQQLDEPKECIIETCKEWHDRSCAEDDASGYYTLYRCSNCQTQVNPFDFRKGNYCKECGAKITKNITSGRK